MNNPQAPTTLAILDMLGSLVAISRDGQDGFATAANNTKAPELQTFFSACSHQREAMVAELQALEQAFGKLEVDENASLGEKLHRAWITLKAALESDEDQALLEEAVRGEEAALKAYQEALSSADPPLSENVIAMIKRHLSSIQDSLFEAKLRIDSGKYKPI